MTCLVHHRCAARVSNGRRQALGAFDIEDDRSAGNPRQHITGKQNHLTVRIDVVTLLGDNSQAITIPVKCKAQFRIRILEGSHQVSQIFRFARVRVVVGKVAVHFTEQLNDLTANGPKNCRSRCPSNAVTTVHHNFHWPGKLDIRQDARLIRRFDVDIAHAPPRFEGPALSLHHPTQILDFLSVNGTTPHHHLEAVVILWIVTAGHLNAAGAQRAGCKVQHGGGHHAHINNIETGSNKPTNQGCTQSRATQSTVTTHRHRCFTFKPGDGSKSFPDGLGDLLCHSGRHNSTNIVGLEDGRCHLHFAIPFW